MCITTSKNDNILFYPGAETFQVDKKTTNQALKLAKIHALICLKAIESFQNRDYEAFNAPVGETACQIRASKVQDLGQNQSFQEILSGKKEVLEGTIKKIESAKAKALFPSTPLLYSEFIEQHEFSVVVNKDLRFLALAYLLTSCNKTVPLGDGLRTRSFPDSSILRKSYSCSKSQASRLISQSQNQLSLASCEYIQEIAEKLGNSELSTLASSSHRKKDKQGRSGLPCYTSTKVIFEKMLQEEQGFLLRIELENGSTCESYYLPNKDKTSFEKQKERPRSLPSTLVVEGNGKKASLPENLSIRKIIYANAAAHTQYFGECKAEPIDFSQASVEKESFLNLKALANAQGFSLENPSCFLIRHIFTTGGQS